MPDAPKAEQMLIMLERMVLIRRVEERLGAEFRAGSLPGGVHLYIGQEATAVGVCAQLTDEDWITSTHRGHGHFLAKGGAPEGMMAEIFGRATGICRGMGGSMHVADFSKGIMGANGIVGGGVGLAAGAALAAQMQGRGRVAVCFFGDGASAQGVVAEALNVGALWRLPMILVCENNGYSEFSPAATVTAGAIHDRAAPYGIPALEVDGNDVLAVWKAAGEACARARAGEGPTLIEAHTYRWRGHIESEDSFITEAYRSQEEIEAWKKRDPIPAFAAVLKAQALVDESALAELEQRVALIVEKAVQFAQQSEHPHPKQVFEFMFDQQAP